MMKKHRMFCLKRESVKEVPGIEKWTLKKIVNPDDPESNSISPIKISSMRKIFGDFQLGDAMLSVTQEHRFGQPPREICFSLELQGIHGDAILYSINNDKMALLSGEIGSPEGRMFELPSKPGDSQAVIEWLEGLSRSTYW